MSPSSRSFANFPISSRELSHLLSGFQWKCQAISNFLGSLFLGKFIKPIKQVHTVIFYIKPCDISKSRCTFICCIMQHIWQGQPAMTTFGSFSKTRLLIELCCPMFAFVLSTPIPVTELQRTRCFSKTALTCSKMVAAVALEQPSMRCQKTWS